MFVSCAEGTKVGLNIGSLVGRVKSDPLLGISEEGEKDGIGVLTGRSEGSGVIVVGRLEGCDVGVSSSSVEAYE
jgi:hypothetical protein